MIGGEEIDEGIQEVQRVQEFRISATNLLLEQQTNKLRDELSSAPQRRISVKISETSFQDA
jgi:hypothetical protein